MKKRSFFSIMSFFLILFGVAVLSVQDVPIEPDSSAQIKDSKKIIGETFTPEFSVKLPKTTFPVENVGEKDLILVTKVIDGDTIEIKGGKRVRYIGIDTPETVDPRKPVQCFGKEASDKNRQLVGGKKVYLEEDISKTDKYGRLLRYIWVDNVLVNELLVREGYAYSSSYPPDIKYQENFDEAQRLAQKENKGLWGTCSLMGVTVNKSQSQSVSGSCRIKGNVSSTGEKIYHLPGQNYYNKTAIDESKGEEWFCTEDEARDSGWRKSKL